MGGAAFLVYGDVNSELLSPAPVRRNLFDRVLGRRRDEAPKWFELGKGRKMVTLTETALQGLVGEFRIDVAKRFPKPWEATQYVLQYLNIDVMTVFVRGEAQEREPPQWYVQLSFSGCAGMADVTSQLAVHWCEMWYRQNASRIAQRHLLPYGFTPSDRILTDDVPPIYVPLGAAGYAMLNDSPNEVDEEYYESRWFQIDGAAMETLDPEERKEVLKRIDTEIPGTVGKKCLCQWCSPDFDPSAIDGLIPFHDS